mmetsp:Transcript_14812/g.28691  ORF Transcript_14812/g.28691 Transcript_14812/m.28691 type:complete len:236 (-) Transcript_14812:8-715(-)
MSFFLTKIQWNPITANLPELFQPKLLILLSLWGFMFGLLKTLLTWLADLANFIRLAFHLSQLKKLGQSMIILMMRMRKRTMMSTMMSTMLRMRKRTLITISAMMKLILTKTKTFLVIVMRLAVELRKLLLLPKTLTERKLSSLKQIAGLHGESLQTNRGNLEIISTNMGSRLTTLEPTAARKMMMMMMMKEWKPHLKVKQTMNLYSCKYARHFVSMYELFPYDLLNKVDNCYLSG